MRKLRENQSNRVYHLISRIAHRAFYLNAGERDRFVDLLRRVADFSGVMLLDWCVMTMVELRGTLGIASRPYFTLHYLSPLSRAGYIETVGAACGTSCKISYRLTRKGKMVAE